MVAPPLTTRNGCYHDSLRFFFFAAAIFLVGFGSPFWVHMEHDAVVDDGIVFKETTNASENVRSNVSRGMTSKKAQSVTSTYSVGLWMWARALECICLVGVVTACVFLTLHCCSRVTEPRSRFLEIFAALSGTLGFGGAMLYVVNIDEDMKDKSRQITQWSFSWGIFLTLIGSAFVFVAAIAVAIFKDPVFNKVGLSDPVPDDECGDDDADDSEDTNALPMTHMSGYPVVVRYPATLSPSGNQPCTLNEYGGHYLLDANGELCLADRDARERPPAYEDVERPQGPPREGRRSVPTVGDVGQPAGMADAHRGQPSVTDAWWSLPAGATDTRGGEPPRVDTARSGQPITDDALRGQSGAIDAQRAQPSDADAQGGQAVLTNADGDQTSVTDSCT